MSDDGVFSVVIPAYGGSNVWKKAIDSVLMQDYPAIELIFADDCTLGFDTNIVWWYINSRKRENIVRYCVVRSEKNVGTVENLRYAHKLCTGKYLTHIAMDDAYCDKTVLSRYVRALETKHEGVLGVYARSLVCDEQLRPSGNVSFDTVRATAMNDMTARQQFGEIARYCCIHMGATAFVREEFMDEGDFDTDFRLIEDWPFFLATTCKGWKFQYVPFDAILYRSGGVTDASFASPLKRACCTDHIGLYEKLILPNLRLLAWKDRQRVYGKYVKDRMDMEHLYGPLSGMSVWQKVRMGVAYFPAHACVWLKRRKKAWIVWIMGFTALLCARTVVGAIVYTVSLLVLQILREKNIARKA